MIQLPSATAVGRVMPKEAFYKRLTLNSELKEKFVTDVRRITLSNSLTAATLNLEAGAKVNEILVLTIDMKKQQFDGRIVENIARQNAHKLLFILRFEDKAQLAVYHAKLYTTAWLPCDEITLTVKGATPDAVWHGFLEQIALQDGLIQHKPHEDINTKLQRQEKILRLQKQLAALEKKAMSERQPRKKWELAEEIKKLKTELGGTL